MMSELLNQKIFQSKSFKSLQLILKNSCIKGSTPSIPYDEFENIVIAFMKEIMKLYLENTEFCNDMCSCVIRDLSNNTLGEFDIKNHINHIIVENNQMQNAVLLPIGNLTIEYLVVWNQYIRHPLSRD